MATILPQAIGKGRAGFHPVKIDMTPMVDLGFLLITFFIFTTSMSEPTVTKLSMPKQSNTTVDVNKKTLFTIVADRNRVYVYEGAWEDAIATGKIIQTGYHLQTGLGNFIRQKQKKLDGTKQREELMVCIKPLATASYQNVVNVLDEMQINNVKRYGIIPLSKEEKAYFSAGK
jgi:biopolymer transport protein ExbD